jgi:hypothetical protein
MIIKGPDIDQKEVRLFRWLRKTTGEELIQRKEIQNKDEKFLSFSFRDYTRRPGKLVLKIKNGKLEPVKISGDFKKWRRRLSRIIGEINR